MPEEGGGGKEEGQNEVGNNRVAGRDLARPTDSAGVGAPSRKRRKEEKTDEGNH
jgi:hypothetical protein